MTAIQLQEVVGVLVVFVVAVIPALQGLTLTYIHIKQVQQLAKLKEMHKQLEDNVITTINNHKEELTK